VDASSTDHHTFIKVIAEEIQKRGLEVPAIALLETYRPLGNVLMHLMLFFSPFLILLLGAEFPMKITQLLENPEGMENLIQLLEKKTLTSQL